MGGSKQGYTMSKNINLDEELYRKLGEFGNRDESWNDIIARLLSHVDEEAAREDRDNRTTTHSTNSNERTRGGNPHVEELDDGTEVRHVFQNQEYETVKAIVTGGRLEYDGELLSPSGAAREADKDTRGSDARESETYRGPIWWEYENEHGEWVPLNQ
jgi:hypothetical protein